MDSVYTIPLEKQKTVNAALYKRWYTTVHHHLYAHCLRKGSVVASSSDDYALSSSSDDVIFYFSTGTSERYSFECFERPERRRRGAPPAARAAPTCCAPALRFADFESRGGHGNCGGGGRERGGRAAGGGRPGGCGAPSSGSRLAELGARWGYVRAAPFFTRTLWYAPRPPTSDSPLPRPPTPQWILIARCIPACDTRNCAFNNYVAHF
ncbi:hypothetical protein EVAR_92462_1 [Eumeta japonica]|uniref:Uncharacterized protein n=1 Tax=Eumeta variegata TaxID=151549 RepID=A0A4C1T610_EUMVA|nr:hypothetical protein EVAR_92462_1 [Eumeta japonica]